MRVKSNKLALRVLSTATFLAMVSSCATAAFAGTYYMEKGSISIVAKTDGNYITQGDINDKKDEGETVITNRDSSTASENTVTIKAEEGSTANVTLDNVNIDASDTDKAAIHTEGNVTLELDGNNTLTGGEGHAALEKISNAKNNVPDENYTLTLQDETTGDGKTGSLTATGGTGAAGIGGGEGDSSYFSGNKDGGNAAYITISGENTTVTATGNAGGAGIGGGKGDDGYRSGQGAVITINGGAHVEATGGAGGAAIGGGDGSAGGEGSGLGSRITIAGEGTTVIATGGAGGAAIGGGDGSAGGHASGLGRDITITGEGTTVTATGGTAGSGIGGGQNSQGYIVDISGGAHVDATGGAEGGAGIGGGKKTGTGPYDGTGSTITISDKETSVTATGNGGGAGIGGGKGNWGQSITISGGEVTANGGGGGAGIGTGDVTAADQTNLPRAAAIQISGGTVTANGGADGAAGIGGGRWAGAGTADSAGVTITNGTVTANGGAGAAGIGDGANNVSDVGSVISITGGTVTANGGAGEAAGIGNGENDANDAAVNISATTARLDVTAVTQGSDEAITGGDDMTMAELNNQFSGVVRFFRGTNHYNTVHNGKYVGMADNNADEHQETDAHIWGSTEIIRQATPTEQGIVRHHCAVDGCKGYYEEFFDYVAPAEPVTPAPTDPDTPDVPGTSDSTPGTPAQGTPADAAAADAVPGAATAEEVSVTPSGAQTVTAAALPKTGVNWLAAVGSAISGMVLLAAGYVLDRRNHRMN